MKQDMPGQTAKRLCCLAWVAVCLAIVLGGCSPKEVPLSQAARTCKQNLLAEMHLLIASLAGAVAHQDWGAVQTILQTSFEKMQKNGRFAPDRIGVLDRDGVAQGVFPPRNTRSLDFRNYQPARTVYQQKKIAQTILYLEGNKIFVLIAPLLQDKEVMGAAVMIFSDESLQKWRVTEKEFLSINFNQ